MGVPFHKQQMARVTPLSIRSLMGTRKSVRKMFGKAATVDRVCLRCKLSKIAVHDDDGVLFGFQCWRTEQCRSDALDVAW